MKRYKYPNLMLVVMKVYQYKGCGTCKKALKYLDEKEVNYDSIPIREQPPTKNELKLMLDKFGIKRLFNTSGMDYRNLGIKDMLPKMSEEEIIDLLSKNGNLIKRPFVIGTDVLLIGFKKEEWNEVF